MLRKSLTIINIALSLFFTAEAFVFKDPLTFNINTKTQIFKKSFQNEKKYELIQSNPHITTPYSSKLNLSSSSTTGNKGTQLTKRGDKFRRQKILDPPNKSRDGHNFKLDRFRGTISFGYTADLVTQLPMPSKNANVSNKDLINDWLSDAERIAFAIWDENLIKELKKQYYRLQLITLKFVTIELSPFVDVLMWSEKEPNNNNDIAFFLESMDFNPNVSILPGLQFNADSLGIQIDVAGELRVSSDGKGITGKIGFTTSGELPPPLRILPESALKTAASVINKQIADFAVRSFQKGAIKEFKKYLKERDV